MDGQIQDDDGNLLSKVKRFSLNDDANTTHTPIKIFDRFYDSSSDDDRDFYSTASGSGHDNEAVVQSAGRRLDYMIQFLDRKLSSPESNNSSGIDEENRSLPEFVGSGGGTGIFKVPIRAAVHPSRPPSLELRPHPLRETQIGCFLRTLECTDSQLWAGSESGVRFWNLSELYAPNPNPNGTGIGMGSGDDDAAPFYQSVQTSPTLCVIGDAGSRLVWSGHRDGRIRCWKMDQQPLDGTPFKRGPFLAGSSRPCSFYSYDFLRYRIQRFLSQDSSISLTSQEEKRYGLEVEPWHNPIRD
ncbi:endonuclease/exonuclease/phosphatase family protein [Actinidia rufa]|uniref:Endonuclease/exonuclease/phosphatase family protein n=1 Tax=Actinidia rufa TaxID=165716 RepID=A0A7J0GKI9_9ERIC|nr:endonuclease/exonuclease/phosphatase family protein [Actinidia rufa]